MLRPTDHPAVLVAVFGILAVAARLLAISRFDVNTATTILERSGTATVTAGTALALLPFALVLMTAFLAVATFVDHDLLEVPRTWMTPLLALSIGATLCMTAIPLAVFTLCVVGGALTYRLAAGPRGTDLREQFRSSRLLRAQGTVLLVALALAPIVLQRPWLPMQAVKLTNGTLYVGYVLGEENPQLAVLRDADRTVVFIPNDEVSKREVCSGTPALGGLAKSAPQIEFSGSFLGALLWGDNLPRYPQCPAPSP